MLFNVVFGLRQVTITGEWGAKATKQVSLAKGDNKVSVDVAASSTVALWWPNGMGAQTMYNVTASFAASGAPQASAAVDVGLDRIVALYHRSSTP
jgi:hypothetical protein